MEHEWQRHVREPDAVRVLTALSSPDWDFRTVEGISHETGLPKDGVQEILKKYQQWVRESDAPGPNGQRLYTLRSRRPTVHEKIASVQAFMERVF